jgi:hypothetical protein
MVAVLSRWHSRRCYERTRGQLFCLLHWKALRRRDVGGISVAMGEERDFADLGKVVNLMQYVWLDKFINCLSLTLFGRGDTYAVAQRFWDFSAVFVGNGHTYRSSLCPV